MLPTIRCIGRSQLIRVGLVTPHDINGVPAYPACAMSRAELGRVLTNARKVPGTSRTPEPRNSRVITRRAAPERRALRVAARGDADAAVVDAEPVRRLDRGPALAAPA